MDEIVKTLVKMGSMGALFLAFLIVALVVLGTIVKSNIEANTKSIAENNKNMLENMKLKDRRIETLESDVKDIHAYIKRELHDIIFETQRVMQKVLSHLEK
jgi:hypothetical protein